MYIWSRNIAFRDYQVQRQPGPYQLPAHGQVHTEDVQKNLGQGPLNSPRAKRAHPEQHPEQHDDKLAEQMTPSQKKQNNYLLGKFTKLLEQQDAKEAKRAEEQEARRVKKAEQQEAAQVKQDKMLETILQLVKNQAADHALLSTLITSQSSLACPSRNISLAQAEEVVQMHKTYQRNARPH
ncbi:hypothetical protein ABBQ38_012475 [Trebouxia sp. C0009 RCD-2024]